MLDRISDTLLIKEGEKRKLTYFLILFLVIGCGMAIGRSTADALFFKRYGIEHLPLMYVLLGGVLFVVTIFYAVFTDRISTDRFLKPLIMIISVTLLACWISMNYFDWELIYPIYFIIYEVISEILLVHCTIYLAQNLDVMQAKRLTPLILGGWQAGTIVGGILLASVTGSLGVHNILLIWIVLLLVAVAMVYFHHQKSGVSAYYRAGRKGRNQLKHAYEQLHQCIVFAKHSQLLRAMSFALFFMVVTFYILCYSVNRIYTENFVSEEELAVFFGILSAITGGLALAIQILLTNRLIRRYGVRTMNLVFPIATLLAIGGLLFSFVLSAAIVGSLVKDALMPAFRNPTRTLFFNAIPTHMQGRAHSFSIGIVLPLALSFAGLSLMLAQSIDSHMYFLVTGFITGIAYLIFNIRMNRSYLFAIITSLREKLFIPDDKLAVSVKGEEREAFEVLEKASAHKDQEIRFISAKSMLELFPTRSVPIVLNVLSSLSPPLRDQLIRMLLPMEPAELKDKLWEEIDKGDDHLRATILFALFQLRDNDARELVQKAINDSNSRIKSIGIYGALHFPVPELTEDARYQWKLMLDDENVASVLSGLDILYRWPNVDFAFSLSKLLHSKDQRIKKAALNVLSVWPDNNIRGLSALLKRFLKEDDYIIRMMATNCLVKLDIEKRHVIAKEILEDIHPDVRFSAVKILFDGSEDNNILVDWIIGNKGSPRTQETVLQYVLSKNPPRQIVEELTHHFSDEAISLLDAYNYLDNEKIKQSNLTPAIEILGYALEERAREFIDLSLISAGKIEDPYTIGTIRAGIKSNEKQHWAKSCEAVRYIQDKKIAASLTVVLENLAEGKDKLIKYQRPQHAGIKALLNWLGDRRDPWLNQCILQVRLSTPN